MESPVRGIGLGYAANVANYLFAVLYVVVLTRYIPLEEYGLYNSLQAALGLLGLLLPSFGVEIAIMRTGAAAWRKGEDASRYHAALILVILTFTAAYLALASALLPRLLTSFPSKYFELALLVLASVVFSNVSTALSVGLWMVGKFESQAAGAVLYSLTFRASEIVLIVLTRSVYAIPISIILGQAASIAYYARALGRIPNPLKGLPILKSGFKRFLSLGVQEWAIAYASSIASNATSYLLFLLAGPSAVGLYNLAAYAAGVVSGLVNSVYSVYLARASQFGGLPIALDYSRTSAIASSVLAASASAFAPLLPIIGVVHGQYAAAIPYAMALLGAAAAAAPLSIFRGYFWLTGRGWRSAIILAAGYAAGVAVVAMSASAMGAWSAVAASYVSAAVATSLFVSQERELRRGIPLVFLLPGLAASLSFALWPWSQLAFSALLLAELLVLRPIPRAAALQLPGSLRRIALRFAQPS